MSIKMTIRITRERALDLLLSDLPHLSNDALSDVLDALADSGQSHRVSRFDNFIVSEFDDDEDNG